MPDHLGGDMRKVKGDEDQEEKEIKCKILLLLIKKSVYFSTTNLSISRLRCFSP